MLSIAFSDDLTPSFRFNSLTLDDGLPNASVSSIQQDSLGYIWFGTQSGLARYDGQAFDIWNHDIFNLNSLPHGLVQTLYIDDDDIVWAGTYNGISRFDPVTDVFTNFAYDEEDSSSLSNNVVTSIVKDREGRIWVATLSGLNKLDPEKGLFKRYLHDEDDPGSLNNDIVRTLFIDSSDRIWIGNLGGLDLYDENTDSFIHYEEFPSPYVMKVIEDEKGSLLIGTWGGGLTRLDIESSTYENISIGDDRIYTMEDDSSGNIWVGTWGGGIYIYDSELDAVAEITSDSSDNSSISSDTIYSIFRDVSGDIWVGTNGGGVSIFNPDKKNFSYLSYDSQDERKIGNDKVDSIFATDEGDLWVGIYNQGIYRYSHSGREIKNYRYDADPSKSKLSNNIISDILMDGEQRLWVSTNEGLNLYNRGLDRFDRVMLHPDENVNASFTYTTLYEDRKGFLWIGTHNVGLIRFDPDNNEVIQYKNDSSDPHSISDNLVYSVIERENGEFWVGTNNGLNRLDRETGRFNRYFLDRTNPDGINNNAIRVMIESNRSELWLGTAGGGINIYDDTTDTFYHITTNEGLSNNFIVSLTEDRSNSIWAGTKYGVSVIDILNKQITVLDKDNGLKSMEFTKGAALGSDHEIYLGTQGNVNRFDRDVDLPDREIFGIYVKSIIANGNRIEDYSMYEPGGEIVFDYNDARSLSFEFVALNFLEAQNIRYSYKLEGFDDNWSFPSSRNYANYTNIQPGEYVFLVSSSTDSDNRENLVVRQNITIKHPFWMTWWAYALYGSAIVLFLYLLISFRISQIRKQKIMELDQSRVYLSKILNSMPSVIISIDKELIITQWNKKAATDFGMDGDLAIGKPLFDIYPDFPVSADSLLNCIQSEKSFNKSERIGDFGKDVHYKVISVYPVNIVGSDGAVIRIDDVTKQVRMEEALVQSEKMLSIGGLAAGMAHEINNPLAGMVQNALVLENRLINKKENKSNRIAAEELGLDLEAVSKYMEMRKIPQIITSINKSGRRASEIIGNILSFSQKNDSQYTRQSLEELVNSTVELASADYNLKKDFDFKAIKITREIGSGIPDVLCEKSKIQQVLFNILKNGAEAMSEVGSEGNEFIIRIYHNAQDKLNVIEIEDNGPGMALEVQKRIFEPFYSTKPVGIGTGLGLSISYFIIKENHKGDLTVESVLGKGTTFKIQLPVDKEML